MRPHSFPIACALLLALLLPVISVPTAHAISDEERETLELFFDEQDRVVTVTRTPKPISQVAENVTVVTAEQIERMNAHTLEEVLRVIPGIQVDTGGAPGFASSIFIDGSKSNHVLLIIDGVIQNTVGESFPDVGAVPVQNIEHIEIIKGPASSMWGAALGGIINVVTKAPHTETVAAGTVSASLGERKTGDYRYELGGTIGSLGYYLFAEKLLSDGFRPSNKVNVTNLYTKVQGRLPGNGAVKFSLAYNEGRRGFGEFISFDQSGDGEFQYLFAKLAYEQPIGSDVNIEIASRTLFKDIIIRTRVLSINEIAQKVNEGQLTLGASAGINWRTAMNLLSCGVDFDHYDFDANVESPLFDSVTLENSFDRWGLYVNNTLRLSDYTLSAGIRYDITGTSGNFVSPNFGVTYRLADRTILRGAIARGFSLPNFDPLLQVEKVFSLQAGIESSDLRYIWLKTTYFRNDTKDVIALDEQQGIPVRVRNLLQGVEVEMKTIPFFDTSVSAGFMFNDAKRRGTGKTLMNVPRYSYDLGIHYDDKESLSLSLIGHYMWWMSEADQRGSYDDFIWDAHLTKAFRYRHNQRIEFFASIRNLFNGAQFGFEPGRNPRRWFEGGIRFKF